MLDGSLIARFHTRSRDKLTPYKMITGKIPKPQTRGVWLGKLDRDESHILGTSSGAIAVRSVPGEPDRQQNA